MKFLLFVLFTFWGETACAAEFEGFVSLGSGSLYSLFTESYFPYVILLFSLITYILDRCATKIELFKTSRISNVIWSVIWILYMTGSLVLFKITEMTYTYPGGEPMLNRTQLFLSNGWVVLGIELLVILIVSSLVFYFRSRKKRLSE